MLANVLKLILVMAVGAASLALVFTFGVIVLLILAVAAPIAYLYMRFKYPEIFEAMKNRKDFSYRFSSPQSRPRDDNIIEVDYERVDEK